MREVEKERWRIIKGQARKREDCGRIGGGHKYPCACNSCKMERNREGIGRSGKRDGE